MPPRSSNPSQESKAHLWMDSVKFILPLALGAIGMYVGLVVAPLDARIASAEKTVDTAVSDIKESTKQVHELAASYVDILRRLQTIESAIKIHVDTDHKAFTLKEDTQREAALLRDEMRQINTQLREVLKDQARFAGRTK